MLTEHNLIVHAPTLDQHEVDMEVLMRLKKEDLMRLGMTLGEAVRLLVAVHRFSELLITEDAVFAFLKQSKLPNYWCPYITNSAVKLLAKKWRESNAFRNSTKLVLGVRSIPRGLDELVVNWPGTIHFSGLEHLSPADIAMLQERAKMASNVYPKTEITLNMALLTNIQFDDVLPLMPPVKDRKILFSSEAQNPTGAAWYPACENMTTRLIQACFKEKSIWPAGAYARDPAFWNEFSAEA